MPILLALLATWRITHLLHAEHGPWGLLGRVRAAALAAGMGAFACFYCLSLWVALPLATLIAADLREALLLWPALSGGAILLHRLTERGDEPATHLEDPP